jgi:hypothetical protein
MKIPSSTREEPRLIMTRTIPRRSFMWDRKFGPINQDYGSSLVSLSINGLVLVLSLMCVLRELWRFIVHKKNQTFKVNGHKVKPYIGVNSTSRAPEPHLVDLKCIFPKE